MADRPLKEEPAKKETRTSPSGAPTSPSRNTLTLLIDSSRRRKVRTLSYGKDPTARAGTPRPRLDEYVCPGCSPALRPRRKASED